MGINDVSRRRGVRGVVIIVGLQEFDLEVSLKRRLSNNRSRLICAIVFSEIKLGISFLCGSPCKYRCVYDILIHFTFGSVVSSDVNRPSCTTSSMAHVLSSVTLVFFQGCPCQILDFINVSRVFHDIIPKMHVLDYSDCFQHACPEKGDQEREKSKDSQLIYDNMDWEFSSCLKFIQNARLSFSPSNISAAFFGSTTFQLLI